MSLLTADVITFDQSLNLNIQEWIGESLDCLQVVEEDRQILKRIFDPKFECNMPCDNLFEIDKYLLASDAFHEVK